MTCVNLECGEEVSEFASGEFYREIHDELFTKDEQIVDDELLVNDELLIDNHQLVDHDHSWMNRS